MVGPDVRFPEYLTPPKVRLPWLPDFFSNGSSLIASGGCIDSRVSLEYHLVLFMFLHVAVGLINLNFFERFHMLRHYGVVWLAIVTSPKGAQIDFWLSLMCAMDVIPLVCAVIQTWWKDLFSKESPDYALLHIAGVMSDWSPAYQFNQVVLVLVDGDFVNHVYVIMALTVAITEGHKSFVGNFYCPSSSYNSIDLQHHSSGFDVENSTIFVQ